MRRRPSRWRANVLLAILFAIPIAYIALVFVLLFTLELKSAAVATGFVTSGTCVLTLVFRIGRTLRAIAAGGPDTFRMHPIMLAFLGFVMSLVITGLTQFDAIETSKGLGFLVFIGALAIALLIVAVAGPN